MPDVQMQASFVRANQLLETGKLEEAETLYLELQQNFRFRLAALHNLGVICERRHQLEEAERYFLLALSLAPRVPEVYVNLGVVYDRLEQWSRAESCYRHAITLQPRKADTLRKLGWTLSCQGRWEDSLFVYLEALTLAPNDPGIYARVADCYQETMQYPEAQRCYEVALGLAPDNPDLHNGRGRLLHRMGQLEESALELQKALKLCTDLPDVYNNLGFILIELGRIDEALECYHAGFEKHPDNVEAKLCYHFSLPIIYRDMAEVKHWRRRYTRALDWLEEETARSTHNLRAFASAFTHRTNFYLQYQGQDDVDLQRRYGKVVHKAITESYGSLPSRPREESQRRIRLGYVSPFFRKHTVGKLFTGFLENHDRDRFELFAYHCGKTADNITEKLKKRVDHFRHIPRYIEGLVHQMRRDQLDIAIFTDVGMDSMTAPLAAARVAPIQCALWGHPVTTGLPTMDYFISCQLMEPEKPEAHYTERLIQLSKIGICYRRPKLPSRPRSRASLELPEEKVLFLSDQSLYKYLPEYDSLFPRIAARLPNSLIVFLVHHRSHALTRLFQQRLVNAFAAAGLKATEHCRFISRLSESDFLSLNLAADVGLDTPSWSGGNTSLEALACGLPIVTLPGRFMRSRHSYAMLKVLGLEECIADSREDYIEIAQRLGQDASLRTELGNRIRERSREGFFDDVSVVRELESKLEEIVRRQDGPIENSQ